MSGGEVALRIALIGLAVVATLMVAALALRGRQDSTPSGRASVDGPIGLGMFLLAVLGVLALVGGVVGPVVVGGWFS
jgi:hypothetical protein